MLGSLHGAFLMCWLVGEIIEGNINKKNKTEQVHVEVRHLLSTHAVAPLQIDNNIHFKHVIIHTGYLCTHFMDKKMLSASGVLVYLFSCKHK